MSVLNPSQQSSIPSVLSCRFLSSSAVLSLRIVSSRYIIYLFFFNSCMFLRLCMSVCTGAAVGSGVCLSVEATLYWCPWPPAAVISEWHRAVMSVAQLVALCIHAVNVCRRVMDICAAAAFWVLHNRLSSASSCRQGCPGLNKDSVLLLGMVECFVCRRQADTSASSSHTLSPVLNAYFYPTEQGNEAHSN